MERDFNKYAFFVSRARNFAIVIKADKKKIVDGEVIFEQGIRMDFNNGMLRVEKTDDNKELLAKLRQKISDQGDVDPRRKAFWEEQPPREMIDKEKVEEIVSGVLEEKNAKIEELQKTINELKNKSEVKPSLIKANK